MCHAKPFLLLKSEASVFFEAFNTFVHTSKPPILSLEVLQKSS